MVVRGFLFVLLLLSISNIFGQTYFFDQYTVKDGLAQSTVYTLAQDQKGFLWIGTRSGVSRFDGRTFTNYTSRDGLAKNGVSAILVDSRNNVWFGHIDGGISRYFKGSLQKWEKLPATFTSRVTSIVEDDDGQIWISSDGSGCLLLSNPIVDSMNMLKYREFKGKEGLSDQVFSIYKTKSHKLLFVTNVGIKVFNKTNETFDYLKYDGLSTFSQITAVHEDKEGNLWLGSWTNGLQFYDTKKMESHFYFKRDGLGSNFITSITSDPFGNIWVATWEGGISKISPDLKITTFNTAKGLPDNKIWKIITDREGNILIGTHENGLCIYKGDYFLLFNENEKLVNPQVYAICQDDSLNYWIGTNGGITIMKFQDGVYRHIKNITFESGVLPSNQIRFLIKDQNGTIWLGTNDYKVWEKPKNEKYFKYNTIINRWFPPAIASVTSMAVDKENNLWVGTVEGLIYYEINNKKSTLLTQKDGLTGNEITAIYCSPDGTIWVGSRGKGISKITGSEINPLKLPFEFTTKDMITTPDQTIWIGTEGQGIIKLKNDNYSFITSKEGLLSDFITAMEVDDEGRIYVGTNLGMNIIDSKSGSIYSYTERKGFTGIEVKDNACYINPAGQVFMGTVNGLIMYDPAREVHKSIEPVTSISRMFVNLKERPVQENMILRYTEKNIVFDFTSISFTDPTQIEYQYYLEGAEESWNPLTTQNHVSYTALRPGKYTFHLKAVNGEGIWNENPVEFHFRIKPPFWQTWPFYIAVIVILIASVILYIQLRTRHLLREKRILEEKVAERTAEVVAQKEQIEKEKEKSEELLLNILPRKVVDDLKTKGFTVPEGFDNVTVYFSDIVGFTDMSAKLDPKILIDELNDIFTAFDDIMVANQCERLKTIGDAYLAVCGMPVPNEKHAHNILNASIQIIHYLENRNKTSQYKWKIRIGVHSGRVVGGIVGVRKYIYDVFGDTINTASRMESNSEPMKINVSESTYKLTFKDFEFIDRGTRDVKGKGPMRMYFVNTNHQ